MLAVRALLLCTWVRRLTNRLRILRIHGVQIGRRRCDNGWRSLSLLRLRVLKASHGLLILLLVVLEVLRIEVGVLLVHGELDLSATRAAYHEECEQHEEEE